MPIPRQIIEEIEYRTDMVRLVSEYTQLRRSGKNWMGLCPFHSEKTGSFSVDAENKLFHCFGCGVGGSMFSFVGLAENLPVFADQVRFLGKRCGVEVPEEEGVYRETVPREKIREANREAARFFFSSLRSSGEALGYLKKRELGMPLVRHFGIGYAPAGGDALYKHMRQQGFDDDVLLASSLCRKKEKRVYDYFRGRLMFPIFDESGDNILAFGGRITGDGQPKYLNTSDTPVYTKSRVLFGMNFARRNCSESLILCEGYMDTVALHGAGFNNAVASCGTALTAEQARLMKKHTKKVVICYDSDEAGQTNAQRAFEILNNAGLECSLVKVYGAKDPDEFIKKSGADAFRKLIENSVSRFDFEYERIVAGVNMSDPDQKIKAADSIAAVLSKINGVVEREIYTRRAAEKMGITYEGLRNDVSRIIRNRDKSEARQQNRNIIMSTLGYGDRINSDAVANRMAVSPEEAVIGILGLHPELIAEVADGDVGLKPDDFVTALNRRVFESMNELRSEFKISFIGDSFSQDEISRITGCIEARRPLSSNGTEEIRQCVSKIREYRSARELSLDDLLRHKREKDKKGERQ